MRVDVYQEDGETVIVRDADLREVLVVDFEEMAHAENELRKMRRYWVGGGAAPLLVLRPHVAGK